MHTPSKATRDRSAQHNKNDGSSNRGPWLKVLLLVSLLALIMKASMLWEGAHNEPLMEATTSSPRAPDAVKMATIGDGGSIKLREQIQVSSAASSSPSTSSPATTTNDTSSSASSAGPRLGSVGQDSIELENVLLYCPTTATMQKKESFSSSCLRPQMAACAHDAQEGKAQLASTWQAFTSKLKIRYIQPPVVPFNASSTASNDHICNHPATARRLTKRSVESSRSTVFIGFLHSDFPAIHAMAEVVAPLAYYLHDRFPDDGEHLSGLQKNKNGKKKLHVILWNAENHTTLPLFEEALGILKQKFQHAVEFVQWKTNDNKHHDNVYYFERLVFLAPDKHFMSLKSSKRFLFLRNLLLGGTLGTPWSTPRTRRNHVVFYPRATTKKRAMVNFEEVADQLRARLDRKAAMRVALAKTALKVVKEWPTSLKSAAQLLSTAKVVILVGGGVDFNVLLLQPGTELIHLMPCQKDVGGISWLRRFWKDIPPRAQIGVTMIETGCRQVRFEKNVTVGEWNFTVTEKVVKAITSEL